MNLSTFGSMRDSRPPLRISRSYLTLTHLTLNHNVVCLRPYDMWIKSAKYSGAKMWANKTC